VAFGNLCAALDVAVTGEFNIANLLGVIGAAMCAGVAFVDAVAACQGLSGVPGRLQLVGGAQEPAAVIDYAHTPDALEKALKACRALAQARSGALHAVFGCGGDRDPIKRPLMGAIAKRLADSVCVTSDNPRSEPPEAVAQAVYAGAQAHSGGAQVQLVLDRAQAIAQCMAQAASTDVVLIAGKGHEDYQEIQGVKYPFSDVAHARAALASRSKVPA
jgi:UDP-N-acetylmuramyl-tripeptide synthetase